MAELLFGMWILAVLGMCIYLVERSFFYGEANRIQIYDGFSIHSGLLTGVFYAMVIFLSLHCK